MSEQTSGSPSRFVAVYRPANHHELIYVKHALDELGVVYYIKNELATLGVLSATGGDEMTVMVPAGGAAKCRQAIQERLRLLE